MIAMRLSEAAKIMQGTLLGQDDCFQGCGIDSRTIAPGELFIAIQGDRFDGHDFIQSAIARGAVAALVDSKNRQVKATRIQVDDTRIRLANLAAEWRRHFSLPVIAITGSNGKTTVKEMVNTILSLRSEVLATEANLNNELGVPLTLFRMDKKHDYAVIEMGANHPGEITGLCAIAQPTVAVITLCAPAHLDGFGSVAGVARAKAEVYAGLTEGNDEGNTAIINADDDFYAYWRAQLGDITQITFGIDKPASVSAHDVCFDQQINGSHFTLHSMAGQIAVSLPLPGKHNIRNALAAAACSLAVGTSLAQIKTGLQSVQAVAGRMQILMGRQQSRIFNDTYNANPVSLAAAMQAVRHYSGEKYLVLGDMAELGQQAEEFHFTAGQQARELGFSRLIATGELATEAVRGFGEGAVFYREREELIAVLISLLKPDCNVLIKGSRSMAMDTIISAICEGH